MSTKKKVWQYHCDFCPKRNLSASGIAKHEKHCTMNPIRVCRMCLRLQATQQPISELIDCLSFDKEDYGLAELSEIAKNCPMCVLAGIRQSGIMETYKEKFPEKWNETGPLDLKWDFKEALKTAWAEVNSAEMESFSPY